MFTLNTVFLFCTFYAAVIGERIVIIGGGASGLAAASKLYQNGFENVTIFEASERLGGRMHSIPAGMVTRNDQKGYLEMGADSLIGNMGSDSPPLKIAFENCLLDYEPLTSEEKDNLPQMEHEGPADFDDFWELWEIMEEEPENKDIDPGISLKQYNLMHRYKTLFQTISKDRHKYIESFIDLYNRFKLTETTATWDKKSSKAFWDYKLPGGRKVDFKKFKADHSYDDIIKILQRDIPSDQIHLYSPVSSINYTDENVIQVGLIDGAVMEADKVIFTGSLGTLKDQVVTFDPALPEDKQKAIELIGFGVSDKIFIEFDQPWLTQEAQQDISGISFMYPTAIEYNEIDAEEDWTRFVSGIYPVAHHPTIAVLWIAGYGATKMESLSEHQLRIDIDNLLRKFNPSMKAWTNATQILTITVKMHCLFQW